MSNSDKYTPLRLEKVESTNAYALEYINSFADRTVIYTPNQTSGRGRYNRKWIGDGTDNIYMSFILKPEEKTDYPFTNLTQYLSIIVCNFLEKEFCINAEIKWPNDILVNGYKISGILAETYTKNNQIKGIVLGLGLNVNMQKSTLELIGQKAVSISVITDKTYDIDLLAAKLSDMFFETYDNFVKNGFICIKNEYMSKCGFLGKNIIIKEAYAEKQYFAKSIDDCGLLVVYDKNNKENKIITGDVLC